MKLKKQPTYIYEISEFCCKQLEILYYNQTLGFEKSTGQFILVDDNGERNGFIYCPFCGKIIIEQETDI